MVKSAVSLKWQVGFENDMKMAPIFSRWSEFTIGDRLWYVLKL